LDVTMEQRDAIIESLAKGVTGRGMETPAVMMLEISKPVSFLVSQAALIAGPLLYPLFGMERVNRFAGFMSSRENVEKLIERIEELAGGKEQ
jgi:hypothetical protein